MIETCTLIFKHGKNESDAVWRKWLALTSLQKFELLEIKQWIYLTISHGNSDSVTIVERRWRIGLFLQCHVKNLDIYQGWKVNTCTSKLNIPSTISDYIYRRGFNY